MKQLGAHLLSGVSKGTMLLLFMYGLEDRCGMRAAA
jgi:hypothetical protein